jgi:CheY-like chemotaxis protein
VKKILLVDDDPAVLDLLGSRLRTRYTMLATVNPQEAVKMAVAQKPDLILCDVDMPNMNGAEVAAALKKAGAGSVPLLYLTGLVSPNEVKDLPGPAGTDRHPIIAKRAPLSELLACIKSLIGE